MKLSSSSGLALALLFAACSDPVSSAGSEAPRAGGNTMGGSPGKGGEGGIPSSATGGRAASGGSSAGENPSESGGAESGGSVSSGGRNATPTTGGRAVVSGGTTGGASEAGAPGSGGTPSAGASSGGASGAPSQTEDVIVSFENGGYWNAVDGKRIEAHGGGFIRVGATWYWIGEDKSHNSGNFRAVNCYSSPDLSRWTFRNAIITRDTAPELDASDRIIERPKVLFNDATKRYVMWLHWEGQNYAEAEAGVFSSATIDGDYEYHSSFRPNRNMSRDDTLFKDDDGKAYFVSAANENADLVIYELTDDYLDIERQVITLWPGSYREAPALFKVGPRYFLVTSGATGWDPNQAKYSTATSIGGPWSALSNLGDGTTFDSQPTYVLPVQGSEGTTYVYAGDRWQDPDLASSKYIWLPLRVSDTTLSLAYYPEWQLNLTRGTWSVDDGYVPQSEWKVVRVSSEETVDEDGRAANAFDDSAATRWHTEYGGSATPVHPHELVIDMGKSYALSAFRHTPRQDKDVNGMVARYEFYVSDSSTDFGAAVATGTFTDTRASTLVEFETKRGRYLRFVALSEVNGDKFASLAELDVVGTPL